MLQPLESRRLRSVSATLGRGIATVMGTPGANAGNDTIIVGIVDLARPVMHFVRGGEGNDLITGSDGRIHLLADERNDTIRGGAHEDMTSAGPGNLASTAMRATTSSTPEPAGTGSAVKEGKTSTWRFRSTVS
jgi:Ca2+-binding RTX toxin-like protein